MGDAIVAAAGAGIYASVEDAVAHMVTQGATYHPRPEHAALYDELYAIFRDLYPALRPDFHRLAAVAMTAPDSPLTVKLLTWRPTSRTRRA